MKRLLAVCLCIFFLCTATSCADMGKEKTIFINNTGKTLIGLYLRHTGQTEWGANRLVTTAANEERRTVVFTAAQTSWDIKIETLDGDFFQTSDVTLISDGEVLLSIEENILNCTNNS